jgi:hypothetical protein
VECQLEGEPEVPLELIKLEEKNIQKSKKNEWTESRNNEREKIDNSKVAFLAPGAYIQRIVKKSKSGVIPEDGNPCGLLSNPTLWSCH